MKHISPVWLTDNLEETLSYYKNVLGFKAVERSEDHYAEVERGSISIRFVKANNRGARNSISSCERAGFADAYIIVDDVISLHQEFKGNCVAIDGEPQDSGYGMVDFIINDINGYRLCFGQSASSIEDKAKVVLGKR